MFIPLLFIVEIKNSGERGYEACDKLASALNKFPEYKDQIVIGTFNPEIETYLKETYPSLHRGASTAGAAGFVITQMLGVNLFNTNKFSCLQVPMSYDIKGIEIKLDKKNYIDRAHRRNIAVQYWTINDKEEMRMLIEMGADVIMTDNPDVMYELLKIYINVNDPYIISRLFGCIYGAILLSNKEKINEGAFSKIINFIYKEIFKNEVVYPDILLRDYALNIIEYADYLNISMDFDINECRPPYKSFNIPNIDIEILKKMYPDDYENNYGLHAIKDSMAPEKSLSGFTGMYGDFGRYTFESSLHDFKDVDKNLVFKYAFYVFGGNTKSSIINSN